MVVRAERAKKGQRGRDALSGGDCDWSGGTAKPAGAIIPGLAIAIFMLLRLAGEWFARYCWSGLGCIVIGAADIAGTSEPKHAL